MISLRVLGGARVERGVEPFQGRAAQRLRLALLAMLAAAPRNTATREKLIRVLWPDTPSDSARRLLTEALYVFRKELAEDAVATAGDEVRLNTQLIRCDLVEFRQHAVAGEWRRAVEAYGGPFLDGMNDDDLPAFARWAEAERAELAESYARALRALAVDAEREGPAGEAAEWWGRLAVHDPYNSAVAVELMRALARRGERERAIRFGETFARRMAEELEMEPDPAVIGLAGELRRAPLSPPAPPQLPVERDAPGASEEFLTPEFEVIRKLGEGSVSKVYLAREPTLGRLVAVKVLGERFAADDTTRTRFEREARAAARVHHPSVAPVFRVGRTAAGLPYIVLPYVSGGTMEDRLAAAGGLSIAEARRYMAQLAAGLAAAHRLGVVHRDVRPANLLYDHELDRVLLTDFGIAALAESDLGHALRLTRPGERLGNPAYASPEQLMGDPVTERADVYSMGVVAFELITGRLPFDASTPIQMTAAHARAEPHRASAFRSDVDADLDDLVRRCLNKRPEQRPFAKDIADTLGWV